MNGRRAATLAIPLALTLALVPLGPAGADTGEDDVVSTSGAAQAPERAFGEPTGTPAPTFENPLARTPDRNATPDQGATPEIAAALSGRAATALTLINNARTQAGVQTLRQDNLLNELAQLAAVAWSTGDPNHPDLSLPIPGYPADGSWVHEWVVVGEASDPISSYVTSVVDEVVDHADATHVGIGYYEKTVDGVLTAYFWVLTVEYDFRDVGPSVPFHEDIAWMNWWRVTTGYTDGTYRPQTKVSRGQMAAFLYRFYYDAPISCAAGARMFSDIPRTHPFCGEIEWLASTGITTGYTDGTYRPFTTVSRQHMAAFLYRAVGPDGPATCSGNTRDFRDIPRTHPFCGEIEWLASTAITTGYTDGTFRPLTHITRGQMSAFLYRTWLWLPS